MEKRLLTRRHFLQAVAGLAATAAAGYGYARYLEPTWVDVEQLRLPVRNLPPALQGRRFAQISDVHLGTFFTSDQLQDAIEQVNRLKVDWLFLTGDYASTRDHRRSSFQRAVQGVIEPLRKAAMPVYAALGNHDLWGDSQAAISALREGGATVLRNDGALLEDGLWVGAIDDLWSGRPSVEMALRDAPAGAVNVLLAHEPDFFDYVVRKDAPVALQLSGHSHGGQVRLPSPLPGPGGLYSTALIVPAYSERYPIGLNRNGSRRVYTNRGLGCWPVPFRINCRPEITVWELVEGDPTRDEHRA